MLYRHEISVGFTDIFGARGRSWLKGLKLPGNDGLILKLALDEVDRLDGLIDEVSRVIAKEAVERLRVLIICFNLFICNFGCKIEFLFLGLLGND